MFESVCMRVIILKCFPKQQKKMNVCMYLASSQLSNNYWANKKRFYTTNRLSINIQFSLKIFSKIQYQLDKY